MEIKGVIEIIKIILPVMSAVGVAILASVLTLKNNIKVQKKFTLQKLHIDKNQEIAKYLMEYTKELSTLLMNISRYRLNILNDKEFQSEYATTSERISESLRLIHVNKVFCPKIESDLEIIQELYADIIDGIINNILISSEELSDDRKVDILKGIETEVKGLQMVLFTVIEDINNILKKELEDLEDL